MSNKKPDSNVQRQIDENLRRVFQATEEEALPDQFTQLLAQLREQENQSERVK
ncbi:NepR family anti-sigma factor [Litorivita pollutaquae]|uniref:NepR family anti-sigma factor n=1 Tax=Litorivita pollutaquae TaxID=2200892 RepID=UPI0013A63730|nr:NepR family anti-sigma factor [Litorivita pollutaquae]